MSRVNQIRLDAQAYGNATDLTEQRYYTRQIMLGCHVTGEDMHKYLVAKPMGEATVGKEKVQCPDCDRSFENDRGLIAHRSIKHKKEASK
jgi:hypothetical protein